MSLRICPQCEYRDPDCWKTPFSHGMEVAYARIDELARDEPNIHALLMNAPLQEKNPIREVVLKHYVYGLWKPTRKGQFVRRRLRVIWQHHKWKPIPMEKYEPPSERKRFHQKKL